MSTRMSSDPSIARDRGDIRTGVALTFEFGHAKASYQQARLPGTSKCVGSQSTIISGLPTIREVT